MPSEAQGNRHRVVIVMGVGDEESVDVGDAAAQRCQRGVEDRPGVGHGPPESMHTRRLASTMTYMLTARSPSEGGGSGTRKTSGLTS